MQAPRLLRTLAARQVSRRFYQTDSYPALTYNDLPSPQGNWKTRFDAQQRKYNAHLVIGVGAVIGSIVVGKAAGFLDFHNDYPERPADIASYK